MTEAKWTEIEGGWQVLVEPHWIACIAVEMGGTWYVQYTSSERHNDFIECSSQHLAEESIMLWRANLARERKTLNGVRLFPDDVTETLVREYQKKLSDGLALKRQRVWDARPRVS